jgi:hypothetical protein
MIKVLVMKVVLEAILKLLPKKSIQGMNPLFSLTFNQNKKRYFVPEMKLDLDESQFSWLVDHTEL